MDEDVGEKPHSRSRSRSGSPQIDKVNGRDSLSPEVKSRKRASKREHKTREKASRRSKDYNEGSKRKERGKNKESKKSTTSEKVIEPENPPDQIEEYVQDMQQVDSEQPEAPVPEETERRDSSPEKEDVELEQVEKPQKKRRWGLTRGEKSVKVSSDMLKDIIPEVKPLDDSEVKLDDAKSSDETEVPKSEKQQRREKLREERRAAKIALDSEVLEEHEEVRQEDMGEESDKEEEVRNNDRQVVVAPDADEGVEDDADAAGRRVSVVDDESVPRLTIRRKTSPQPTMSNALVRGRPDTHSTVPSRNPISEVIIIKNLVRPFTEKQLKELLERTGTIQENGFWLDKIKSCCVIKFSEESEAVETRDALHGVNWPVSNHKTLIVDFTTDEDLTYHQSHGDVVPPARPTQPIQRNTGPAGDDRRRGRGFRDNNRDNNNDNFNRRQRNFEEDQTKGKRIREWDLAKIGERSPGERERERERKREDRDRERMRREREKERERERSRSTSQDRHRRKSKKENTPPAKVLEDLFRKTTTTPCIYWLPLTLEQISEKEQQRRKKMLERERILSELAADTKPAQRMHSPARERRR